MSTGKRKDTDNVKLKEALDVVVSEIDAINEKLKDCPTDDILSDNFVYQKKVDYDEWLNDYY